MGLLDNLKDKGIDALKSQFPGASSAEKSPNNLLNKGGGGGLQGKLGDMMSSFGGSNDNPLGGLLGGGDGGGDGGGLGGLFGFPPGGDGGGGNGDIPNPLKKETTESGKPGPAQPFLKSKKAAKENLLTAEPKKLTEGTPMDESSQVGNPGCFGTTHIRTWVRNEFKRREYNFGINQTFNGEFSDNIAEVRETSKGSGEFTDEYVDSLYRGPKTAWMRVISNAIGKNPDTEEPIYGFEMHGVKSKFSNGRYEDDPIDFHQMYGFDMPDNQGGKTFLGRGWDSNENRAVSVNHMVEETNFAHRPSPGITSIKSEDKEPGKNYRETTINFAVHSRDQLDYMDDYFFKIGVTCIVEWGWNTYPRNCLIDPTNMGTEIQKIQGEDIKNNPGLLTGINNKRREDEGKLPKDDLKIEDIDESILYRSGSGTGLLGLFTDPVYSSNHLSKGKGNYSYVMGMISNYSYNLRDDGGYDCEVKVTSMAKMASGLDNESTKPKGKKGEPKDERQRDFKMFVEEKLDEILEGDTDPNEWWDGFDQGIDDISATIAKSGMSKGRFFQFDQSNSGKETYHSDHEDSYITIGYLIDIINMFYAKTSTETNIGMYQFNVSNSRCVAHPNIKSTDGKVLLIPNKMSPRHNNKTSQRDQSDTNRVSNKIINYLSDSDSKEALLTVINSERSGRSIKNLNSALVSSPRDDLHNVLRYNARMAGYPYAVKPFPDFATMPDGERTLGYSGRIQDLFVNYNVVKDAVQNGSNITEILKDILKKVSTAGGGIWDFDLVGPDTGSPNNSIVQIVDRRFPGLTTAYDIQKEDQLFRFKSHTKNSIVKGLSLDVSCATEVAGQVMFMDPPTDNEEEDDSEENPQTAFFARGREDRILKKGVSPNAFKTKKIKKPEQIEENEDDIESEEKFIIGADPDGLFNSYDIEMVDPDVNRMLGGMKRDNNKLNCVKNNMPLDGCEISMELDGIEGLRLLDVFTCTGVPTHYFINGHWRIKSVAHDISGNNWITSITGEYVPSVKTT